MDPQSASTERPILVALSEKLIEAQQELDHLILQLGLGKAEAHEKFEEIRKQFKVRIGHLRGVVVAAGSKEDITSLVANIDALEKLLTAPAPQDAGTFQAHVRKLILRIKSVDEHIRERFKPNTTFEDFIHEAELFKLKLEILRLRFVLKKVKARDRFHQGVILAQRIIHAIVKKSLTRRVRFEQQKSQLGHVIRSVYGGIHRSLRKIH